jgi:phosphoglycerate dehydrogenase-like enzyme
MEGRVLDGVAIHHGFEAEWPFAADAFCQAWSTRQRLRMVRLGGDDGRLLGEVFSPEDSVGISRLAVFGVPYRTACLGRFPNLRELTLNGTPSPYDRWLRVRGVQLRIHPDESYWGGSVAEFALALTLASLRSLAQWHGQLVTEPRLWRTPGGRAGQPTHAVLGTQCVDDQRYVNGTLAGKRVRVIGLGHIGSRFGQFARLLGADVAAWDPVASQTTFALAGVRRCGDAASLLADADVVAPMMPLNEATEELLGADLVEVIPRGALLVLVTRAGICDMVAVRRRVLAGELALAADVFDREPMPPDDPLLGLGHVTHTPHVAGRTRDANVSWGKQLAAQFSSSGRRP